MSATLKQLGTVAAAGSASGIDQCADIGFARGDDTVERRGDVLEAFQRLQPVDFALIDGDFGIRRTEARLGAVVIGLLAFLLLHGHDAFRRVAPALVGRLRELLFGLSDFHNSARRVELGLRSRELGVEIWRFDLGQHVAFFDVRAVIKIPLLQIAGDAGINRRLVPGLHGAGQHQALGGGAGARGDDRDSRDRLFLRPLRDLRLVAAPLQEYQRRRWRPPPI